MARHIFRCPKCDSFTMQEACSRCEVKSVSIKPPKYSPDDKYGKYRREIKEPERKDKDLL